MMARESRLRCSDCETTGDINGLAGDAARMRSSEEANGPRDLFRGCNATDRMQVHDGFTVWKLTGNVRDRPYSVVRTLRAVAVYLRLTPQRDWRER